MEKYILGFIPPYSANIVYLAKSADIDAMCYKNPPVIYGTTTKALAKIYDSIDALKSDLYKLRYYHREFLSIACAVIKVTNEEITSDMYELESSSEYALSSFIVTNET